jgi:hypothetical protein
LTESSFCLDYFYSSDKMFAEQNGVLTGLRRKNMSFFERLRKAAAVMSPEYLEAFGDSAEFPRPKPKVEEVVAVIGDPGLRAMIAVSMDWRKKALARAEMYEQDMENVMKRLSLSDNPAELESVNDGLERMIRRGQMLEGLIGDELALMLGSRVECVAIRRGWLVVRPKQKPKKSNGSLLDAAILMGFGGLDHLPPLSGWPGQR